MQATLTPNAEKAAAVLFSLSLAFLCPFILSLAYIVPFQQVPFNLLISDVLCSLSDILTEQTHDQKTQIQWT